MTRRVQASIPFASRLRKSGHCLRYSHRNCGRNVFDFPEIGALGVAEARIAINRPIEARGIQIAEAALRQIVRETHGYPYFLQEWGKHTWDTARASPITLEDVRVASQSAVAALDEKFFRLRFYRLIPVEREYHPAIAETWIRPHRI